MSKRRTARHVVSRSRWRRWWWILIGGFLWLAGQAAGSVIDALVAHGLSTWFGIGGN